MDRATPLFPPVYENSLLVKCFVVQSACRPILLSERLPGTGIAQMGASRRRRLPNLGYERFAQGGSELIAASFGTADLFLSLRTYLLSDLNRLLGAVV